MLLCKVMLSVFIFLLVSTKDFEIVVILWLLQLLVMQVPIWISHKHSCQTTLLHQDVPGCEESFSWNFLWSSEWGSLQSICSGHSLSDGKGCSWKVLSLPHLLYLSNSSASVKHLLDLLTLYQVPWCIIHPVKDAEYTFSTSQLIK